MGENNRNSKDPLFAFNEAVLGERIIERYSAAPDAMRSGSVTRIDGFSESGFGFYFGRYANNDATTYEIDAGALLGENAALLDSDTIQIATRSPNGIDTGFGYTWSFGNNRVGPTSGELSLSFGTRVGTNQVFVPYGLIGDIMHSQIEAGVEEAIADFLNAQTDSVGINLPPAISNAIISEATSLMMSDDGVIIPLSQDDVMNGLLAAEAETGTAFVSDNPLVVQEIAATISNASTNLYLEYVNIQTLLDQADAYQDASEEGFFINPYIAASGELRHFFSDHVGLYAKGGAEIGAELTRLSFSHNIPGVPEYLGYGYFEGYAEAGFLLTDNDTFFVNAGVGVEGRITEVPHVAVSIPGEFEPYGILNGAFPLHGDDVLLNAGLKVNGGRVEQYGSIDIDLSGGAFLKAGVDDFSGRKEFFSKIEMKF
ncbi:MAG: hypothetical protein AB8B83_07500 [Bdellovibrionales bacterium]